MFVDYQPIPVAEARGLASRYGKAFVIILAYDAEVESIHTTTYGSNIESKWWAARLGEIATNAIGADTNRSICFEDFRRRVEGTYEEER